MALVTGGTRGIGAAICHQLADEGAEIAAGYWRQHEPAEKFMEGMSDGYPGRRITIHHGNIGDADDCRRVVGEVVDHHGRLDILVNNAGITIDRTVAKMTDEDWQKVIAVNLSGASSWRRRPLSTCSNVAPAGSSTCPRWSGKPAASARRITRRPSPACSG